MREKLLARARALQATTRRTRAMVDTFLADVIAFLEHAEAEQLAAEETRERKRLAVSLYRTGMTPEECVQVTQDIEAEVEKQEEIRREAVR